MPRERLEVADIFRAHGPAWRRAQAGHLSLGQLKVMAATRLREARSCLREAGASLRRRQVGGRRKVERCRTAALGGHVAACQDCGHSQIAYQNKAAVYDLLFKAAAKTLITIAADPKHLGARIGITAVLHTWGSAMTHHPHVHCIVPGGGLSPDGAQWVSCRPGFFLAVRVLSRLFRRLFLEKLAAAHEAGRLRFFNDLAPLADAAAFAAHLAPLRKVDWVVYAKAPFAGPEAVLAYLSRYTHRVAISNSRLIALDDQGVTFTWKDYRSKGRARYKTLTLAAPEFMRRFLLHVLPPGFHRIRHYGLFANGGRAENLARARELLAVEAPQDDDPANDEAANDHAIKDGGAQTLSHPCPCCGGPMIIIETFEPAHAPRAPPPRKADRA